MSIKILNGARSVFYDLDVSYQNGNVIGRFSWDQDNATAQLGLNANVVSRLGQDDMWYVKNQSGSTIPKGTVVSAVGTLGASGRILVSPSVGDGSVPARFILGVTAEDILNGADGYVIAKGKLRGIDTSAYTDGTVLWLNPAVNGGLTSTEPQAPNLKVAIAFVVHSSLTNGVLAVRTDAGTDLRHDSAVQIIGTPSTGQLLRYNTNRWENWTPNFALAGTNITIAGTTNQVNVVGGTQDLSANRTWTLSLPQNIHTGATPTFAGITSSSNIAFSNTNIGLTWDSGTEYIRRVTGGDSVEIGINSARRFLATSSGVEITGDAVISGRVQATGLSTSWGTTSGINTGAYNSVMGTGANATWLLSGTSGGTFRAGIQALDSDGTLRFYQGANFFSFSGSTLTVANLAGNASSATVLQTTRAINGTNFNGSANITTANWGTARTITIGGTGKSVNGSANVSWTIDEIQAEYRVPINTIRNNLGNPTVREAALFHGQFNNKFRFIPPTLQEESTDGTTWVASSRATANQLADMMLGEGQATTFNAIPSGTVGTYGGYRLTWNVVGTTGYVFLDALYVYCSTSGNNVTFRIERFHNTTGWETVVSGLSANNWPGHVYIPHTQTPYSNSASQYSQVRITIETTRNANTNAIVLYGIEWFGGYPAGQRNAESYDRDKNVYFPAGLFTNGSLGTRASATASAATHIPVFTSSPASSRQTIVTRTPAQLLSDIGAAPASGSANYIQNQTAVDQSAGFRINGEGRASAYSSTNYNSTTTFGTRQSNSQFLITLPTTYTGGWAVGNFYNAAGSSDATAAIGLFGSNTVADRLFMAFGTSPWSSTGLYVTSANNVAIGATSASEKLHVVGNGLFTGWIQAGNLRMTTNTLSSQNTNGDVIITPNGTGAVLINRASQAGTHKLQVTGNISMSGGSLLDWGNGDARILSVTVDANNRALAFQTWNNVSSIVTRWTIGSTGILESNGAQTIRTSTGSLTLASNAGDGDIRLTPHNTGIVYVGSGTKSGVIGRIEVAYDGAANGIGIFDGTGLSFRIYRDGDVGYLSRGAVPALGINTASRLLPSVDADGAATNGLFLNGSGVMVSRTLGSMAFASTANYLPLTGGTLTGNLNLPVVNPAFSLNANANVFTEVYLAGAGYHYYPNGSGSTNYPSGFGATYTFSSAAGNNTSDRITQVYADRDADRWYLRRINNSTSLGWREIWHSGNFTPADYLTTSAASANYLTITTAGATYATRSTTITINGTAQDLSANRTWNISVSNLTDTTISSVADGQFLKYVTGLNRWVNASLTTADISSGTLSVVRGGTGLNAIGTSGQLLRVNAAGNALEYWTANYLTTNQTITLSGAVTGSGTTAITTTLAANIVGNTNLRDSAALSVIGRSANSTGDPADISAGTDHQVLRRSGTTLGFGAIALNQSAAVTGTLAVGNGGTGAATFATSTYLRGNGTGAIQADSYATVMNNVGAQRTLTINGVSQTLGANRTWTINTVTANTTVTTQDWNTLVVDSTLSVAAVAGATGSNMPSAYNWGALLNFSGGTAHVQLYVPENAPNAQRGIWYRSGFGTGFGPWYSLIEMNNATQLAQAKGGQGTTFQVISSHSYNTSANTALEIFGSQPAHNDGRYYGYRYKLENFASTNADGVSLGKYAMQGLAGGSSAEILVERLYNFNNILYKQFIGNGFHLYHGSSSGTAYSLGLPNLATGNGTITIGINSDTSSATTPAVPSSDVIWKIPYNTNVGARAALVQSASAIMELRTITKTTSGAYNLTLFDTAHARVRVVVGSVGGVSAEVAMPNGNADIDGRMFILELQSTSGSTGIVALSGNSNVTMMSGLIDSSLPSGIGSRTYMMMWSQMRNKWNVYGYFGS